MYSAWVKSPFNLKYRITHPASTVKGFGRNFKFCLQRIRRGWSDADVWNMDTWFVNVVPDMLRSLADNTHSFPIEFVEQYKNYELASQMWQYTLRGMADLFEKSYGDGIEDVSPEDKDRAFEVFSKYFFDLWD